MIDALTVGALGACLWLALFIFFASDAASDKKREMRKLWESMP